MKIFKKFYGLIAFILGFFYLYGAITGIADINILAIPFFIAPTFALLIFPIMDNILGRNKILEALMSFVALFALIGILIFIVGDFADGIDILFVLGDRSEALSAALAAL